jgi:hypothetical protein
MRAVYIAIPFFLVVVSGNRATIEYALAEEGVPNPLRDENKSGAIQFQPRSDEYSAADLKQLRWILSQIKNEKGEPDPLADYVAKPSSQEERDKRSHWKDDDEAHVKPKLFKKADDYVSPDLQPSSIGQTPPVTGPITPASATGPSQRVVVETIADPCFVPLYARMPLKAAYVSSNMPSIGSERSAFQPNVPTNRLNQNDSVLPNSGMSVLPNSGMPYNPAFNPPYNPAFNPPANLPYNPPANPAFNPPVGGMPNNVTNPPMSNIGPSTATPIVPSPSGFTNTPMTGGMTMPAPPPTYANPSTINPYTAVPPAPRYDTRSTFINSQPFVGGPVVTRDASHMVSPTVYRQNVPCTTCGNQPYAPGPTMGATGSPFSYAPQAYFPSSFNGVNTTFKPLVGFGQNVNLSQLGRGIVGQPVAYMPSQPLRNVLRYLFP